MIKTGPGGLGISLVTDGTTVATGVRQLSFSGASVTSEGAGTGAVDVAVNGSGSALSPKSVDGILFADQFASIQAAHDALPTGGGMIVLPPNTTYSVAATITISKNNVHLWAPSWATVLQRAPGFTATEVMSVTGTGCLVENMTFDGNTVLSIGAAECQVHGANGTVRNCQFINSYGTINLALSGENTRATGNTVTGPAIALSTERGIGIWAGTSAKVMIDHNVISGTPIAGIAFCGNGSMCSNNKVYNCHWWAGQGGQIDQYAQPDPSFSAFIVNNWIGGGGSAASGGIEMYGPNTTVVGNTITNTQLSGIGLSGGSAFTVTGNTVVNSGQQSGGVSPTNEQITVNGGVTDFVISGNRLIDNQATVTSRWSIAVTAGASDRYVIEGNLCSPAGRPNGEILDDGTGLAKVIANNVGVADVISSLASAGTITLPVNPSISLTGSATVTSIAASHCYTGRTGTFIPTGAVVFTAGATIGNTVTCVPNVPLGFIFDGTKLYLR